ncbi:hypothetical protein [Rhizobium leguminosarum]|uniref:hypothetical protein n=1 Tax=Rhizobium leguminosarum TaxID=384 RepID=UPI001038CF0B|nr:hypothetical protein [Rhizobium leguminosarum]TBZ06564.1 hypothetical protein E0H38_32250 [Rhizobium leguminosarum bv. viciae]
MRNIEFRSLFPVYPPILPNNRYCVDVYWDAYRFLSARFKLKPQLFDIHSGAEISVSRSTISKSVKERFFKEFIFIRPGDWQIQFDVSATFPTDGLKDWQKSETLPNGFEPEELPRVWASSVPSFADNDIQTFLFALNIAFPGSINITNNIWLYGKKRHPYSSHYRSTIQDGVDFFAGHGFFPDVTLSPSTVVDAIYRQNGMLNGRSDTPLSRAVSYLTRLYVRDFRNDELSDLAWAVAGIEALLVDAGKSSVGQLKSKIAVLFKDHDNLSWLLKSCDGMYSFRSKMIHGNRQLTSVFRQEDEHDESRQHEEYDSSRFAIGLLLLLIRRAIYLGQSKFEFELLLKNTAINPGEDK